MKKMTNLIGALASIFCTSAFAVSAQSGVFIGANTGISSADSKPSLGGINATNRNYVAGGSLGYNYALDKNTLAGVEANYSDFGKTTYSASSTTGNFSNSALQLLLTGTYLMDNGFNTFVKVGAAHQQSELTLNGNSARVTKWLPAFAAGLGYEFIQNLNVYGQYERTFGNDWDDATLSSTPSRPASLNIFSVGVNYTLPL